MEVMKMLKVKNKGMVREIAQVTYKAKPDS